MPTFDHPETDGQTEHLNRVLEDILRGDAQSFPTYVEFLPMVEFAINNSVHATTTHTPFYGNGLQPLTYSCLIQSDSEIRGGLAHHVLMLTPIRLMPISTMSTLKDTRTSIATTLLLHQTMVNMLNYSAPSMTMP